MVASVISRARGTSMIPAASAAPVAARRQVSSTARSAHAAALYWDMVSSSATSAAAEAGTWAGRPSSPVPVCSSRAAARAVICATAASSFACAQDPSRRHDPAAAARSSSVNSATGAAASHAARSGPGGQLLGDPPGQRRYRDRRPAVPLQVIEDLLLNRFLILKHRTRQDTITSAIIAAPASGGGRARRSIARRDRAAGRRARRAGRGTARRRRAGGRRTGRGGAVHGGHQRAEVQLPRPRQALRETRAAGFCWHQVTSSRPSAGTLAPANLL